MQFVNSYSSPLGSMTMASDGENLIGLWFDGQKYDRQFLTETSKIENLPIFQQTKQWLNLYFQGVQPDFTPQLKVLGSEFKQLVADILISIPYGKTMTYGEIASIVAKRMNKSHMSAQAVGGAVGHNCISIIIPCHRVLGSDGTLTGYAGGIERKKTLLRLEGICLK